MRLSCSTQVGLIGVGNIGGALAHSLLAVPGISLLLYDIRKNLAKGKMKDLAHAHTIAYRHNVQLTLADSLDQVKKADIIVVMAGQTRQPGMDRSMLMQTNAQVLRGIGEGLRGTEAVVIVVTNPVDAMTQWLGKCLDIPKNRILGMAGTLDEARFIGAVAKILELPKEDISGTVIGAHNKTMVPLLSSLTWGGGALEHEQIDRLLIGEVIERTRKGGEEIVQLLDNGSAYFGPAEAIKSIIEAIMYDSKKCIRASVHIGDKMVGQTRLKDLCCGLPVQVGREGWSLQKSFSMNKEEDKMFALSVESLREDWERLEEMEAHWQ